jgi:SAM-dependent methyltransferase
MNPFEICCPFCRSRLIEKTNETLECDACHHSFPVIFGIPDLRIFPDPYVDFETDRSKARHLASRFDDFTFEEFVSYYYTTTTVVPPHHAKQYTRGILAAESKAETLLQEHKLLEPLLEIGCGTGPLLIAAARRFEQIIGIDIALRWLIVAKKRLEQSGFSIPLICACAEALPFTNSSFSTAVFDSTLEVVSDQKKSLDESYRVLKPEGTLVIRTPNRFSLGPDPHLNLWAGGFFPHRWIAAYARRQNAIPPKRKLLSILSLRRLIQASGFQLSQSTVPPATAENRRLFPRLSMFYSISRKSAVGRFVLQTIGPLLETVARKPS